MTNLDKVMMADAIIRNSATYTKTAWNEIIDRRVSKYGFKSDDWPQAVYLAMIELADNALMADPQKQRE